jgi:hypothetical protein
VQLCGSRQPTTRRLCTSRALAHGSCPSGEAPTSREVQSAATDIIARVQTNHRPVRGRDAHWNTET